MTSVPKNYKSATAEINLSGIRQFDRAYGAAQKMSIKVGFVSKAKMNKKKSFFNIIRPAYGRPERNPVTLAKNSEQAQNVLNRFSLNLFKEIFFQVAQASSRESTFSPFSGLKRVFNQVGREYSQVIKDQFALLEPVKQPEKHKITEPLVESGKLKASVKHQFWRRSLKKKK